MDNFIPGHIAMLVSELDGVRDDRDACFVIGSMAHFFYTAAAVMLCLESYAVFQAIISGVVGGRTKVILFLTFLNVMSSINRFIKVYLCYGWGLPFITLGVNILGYLDLMGTDPRCMISWFNEPKWIFFGPVMAFAAVSLF